MEQTNCPDPRNCSNIHYFGRCPYQHQACNRGHSCPYVKQNNCQFYHPEEDYPQYKPKKTVTMKPVQIKLSGGGGPVPPSEWSSLKNSGRNIAKKAPVEIIQTSTLSVPPPPPRIGAHSYSASASPHRPIKEEDKNTKQNHVLAMHKNTESEVRGDAVPSTEQQETDVAASRSTDLRMSDYITTKLKEQEEYLKVLRQRVEAAEGMAQMHRGRAEEMQNDAQKFLTCWSRAVKTLEMIRESGIYLDERLERAISCHCVALRSHEKSSIYAPKLSEFNSTLRSSQSGTTIRSSQPGSTIRSSQQGSTLRSSQPGYFSSPSRRVSRNREVTNRYWEDDNLDLGLGIAREGGLTFDSKEAGLAEELPVATRMSLDSLSGSGKSIFGESLLGLSFPDM